MLMCLTTYLHSVFLHVLCICVHISVRTSKSSTFKARLKLPVTVRWRVVQARLCASQGDKEKERGGVIRIFLSAAQASDEMVKFLALALSLSVSAHL